MSPADFAITVLIVWPCTVAMHRVLFGHWTPLGAPCFRKDRHYR